MPNPTTLTSTTLTTPQASEEIVGTLTLVGRSRSSEGGVHWNEEVVDNEEMGRKKSKSKKSKQQHTMEARKKRLRRRFCSNKHFNNLRYHIGIAQ
jgi:hypothetical protein